ncbi:MAG: hypothetical protein NTY66_00145 [Candidatus Vogelbacteria bacterium]|nr:hypothetical protein [Candidatus Vogelbacteria bacterium]
MANHLLYMAQNFGGWTHARERARIKEAKRYGFRYSAPPRPPPTMEGWLAAALADVKRTAKMLHRLKARKTRGDQKTTLLSQ